MKKESLRDIERYAAIAAGSISLDAELENKDSLIHLLPADDNYFDTYGLEKMFHTIPQEQLEILVCLYLGLKPIEIVKVLQYPNIRRFYNVSVKLKQTYRREKERFLAYN